MSHENFDIASLAAYLHLAPEKVRRMADRGQLPGRKVGGQWQFSVAEIHHWLEDLIGASDDADLAQVEQVLERADPHTDAPQLAELLAPGGVDDHLAARTRGSVIKRMCELAASTGMLWDPDKMEQAVRARESLHPTALDSGVALLHPRRPLPNILSQCFLALGRTGQGLPFGGSGLTDLFFLICSTSDSEHLRLLARLSRLLSQEKLVDALRAAVDEQQMRQVLADGEEALDGTP